MSENEIFLSVGVDIDGRILHAKCGLMFTRDTRIFRGYSFDPFFFIIIISNISQPKSNWSITCICISSGLS